MTLAARPMRPWLLAGVGVGTALLVGVLILSSRAAAGVEIPDRNMGKTGARGRSLDISSRIYIVGATCQFGPALSRAFENMLHHEGATVVPRVVRFGSVRLVPSLSSPRDEDPNGPDVPHYDSVVTFSTPAIWNGLRLRALRAETGWEWAASTMEFVDPPARVRATLRRIGIRIPASGMLDLPGGECSSSITVEARGTGSALSCSGGC